jgi:hypothetical protein
MQQQDRMQQQDYERKLRNEQRHFQDQEEVHALPEIFHYWSNRYVRPMVEEFGFASAEQLYAQWMLRAAQQTGGTARFVSIGAGNGDLEVRLSVMLRDAGLEHFTLECLEMNPAMLQRGRELALAAGVEAHVQMVEGDFNRWQPKREYHAVFANQALHHVLDLESLYDAVKCCLYPRGYFITNDMIGRNGHMRWPEALEALQPFWRELPYSYRWNPMFQRHEEEYINHDCSDEGFEGIRAQDVLPLLVERFDFELFVAFGNLINVFVDRVFGHHFRVEDPWDRDFIDRVHAVDEQRIRAGSLCPTQMFAVMTPGPADRKLYSRGLSPQHCIRKQPVTGQGDGAARRLEVVSSSLQPLRRGEVQFRQQIAARGGAAPYRFRAQDLPPGLHLNEDGLLEGRITEVGTYRVTIHATDSSNPPLQASQRYSVLVTKDDLRAPLMIPAGRALPDGAVNLAYDLELGAAGGRPPFRWEPIGGNLPRGLLLDPDGGRVHGVCEKKGSYRFRLRVRDGRGDVADSDYRLTVAAQRQAERHVLPQVVAGPLWETEIEVANLGAVPADVHVQFHNDDAEALTLPAVRTIPPGADSAEAVGRESIYAVVDPGRTFTVLAGPEPQKDVAGWASIEAEGRVHVLARLRFQQGAAVPLAASRPMPHPVLFPFDQKDGGKTALALVWQCDEKAKVAETGVLLKLVGSEGGVLDMQWLPLVAPSHRSFLLADRFQRSCDQRGYVFCQPVGGSVSLLALQFDLDGQFRVLPLVDPTGDG